MQLQRYLLITRKKAVRLVPYHILLMYVAWILQKYSGGCHTLTESSKYALLLEDPTHTKAILLKSLNNKAF